MYRVGELVKWMCPLDADYSYGTMLEIKRGTAKVVGSGYYEGIVTEVHLKYIKKHRKKGGAGFGSSCKRNHK